METKQLEPIWDHITPSSGVRAMIDGIKKFRDDKDFVINMDTFGNLNTGICHGCAATCTVFHLVNEKPTKDNIDQEDHPFNGFIKDTIIEFEHSIDNLRSGFLEDYIAVFPSFKKEDEDYMDTADRAMDLRIEFERKHDVDLFDMELRGFPLDSEIDKFLKVMEQVEQFLKKKGL